MISPEYRRWRENERQGMQSKLRVRTVFWVVGHLLVIGILLSVVWIVLHA